MASVLDSFCIYHVTAPGQEPGAKDLPDGFSYPTMDELSEQVCKISTKTSSKFNEYCET